MKNLMMMGVGLFVLVLGVSVVNASDCPPPDQGVCISSDFQSDSQLLVSGEEEKQCDKKKKCDKAKKGCGKSTEVAVSPYVEDEGEKECDKEKKGCGKGKKGCGKLTEASVSPDVQGEDEKECDKAKKRCGKGKKGGCTK